MEALRSYIRPRILSSTWIAEFSITPDKKDIFITVAVTEGPVTVYDVRTAARR